MFIASAPYWNKRFAQRRLPIIGDDIKSQFGATIVHRILTDLWYPWVEGFRRTPMLGNHFWKYMDIDMARQEAR